MAPLDRALALAEVHHVAVVVADDLELDVARVLEVLLDVDVAVAEGGLGLALRGPEQRRRSSSALRTTRMPRPPPPATALMITG